MFSPLGFMRRLPPGPATALTNLSCAESQNVRMKQCKYSGASKRRACISKRHRKGKSPMNPFFPDQVVASCKQLDWPFQSCRLRLTCHVPHIVHLHSVHPDRHSLLGWRWMQEPNRLHIGSCLVVDYDLSRESIPSTAEVANEILIR